MFEKQFNEGEIIFKQGDIGKTFYQILEGTVGIFVNYNESDQMKLTELKKDQFFGEMAVLEVYPRSATAVCLENGTKVAEYDEKELDAFLMKDPDNAMLMIDHLGDRLRSLTQDYKEACAVIDDCTTIIKSSKNMTLDQKVNKHISFFKAAKATKTKSVEQLRSENKASKFEGRVKNIEKYPAGTVIFKEGEKGKCMYCVQWGRVAIVKDYGRQDETILTELYPDEFFGEMGMVSDEPRSATAVAMDDDTVVEIIYLDDLKEMFTQNPPKASMIVAHLSNRLRSLTRDYTKACEVVYTIYGNM